MVSRRKLAAPRAVLALPWCSRAISTSPVPAAMTNSVVVALDAFLAQSVGLTDGGIKVDGQLIVARPGTSRPGSGQHFPIQLARGPNGNSSGRSPAWTAP